MERKNIKHAFLVGDIHLDTRKPHRQNAFCRFLDMVKAEKPDHLFLLGDLFEFWFGYKTVMFSGYLDVVKKIGEIADSGIEITYLTGNHDFCLGPVFETQDNLNVVHEPVHRILGDHKVHISHGDQINSADWKYGLLRMMLRNKAIQALFRFFVPPTVAWYLGRGTSDSSRKISSDRERPIPEPVFDEFCRRESSGGTSVVIHGHNHDPGSRIWSKENQNLQIIDSGSWLGDQGHYVEFRDGHFLCKQWTFTDQDY